MNRVLAHTRVLGIIFLALVVGSVWLTYAIFTKKFTDYQDVTLVTSKIGLQLPKRADVKVRGIIVGEVTQVTPTEDGAKLTLGLFKDKMKDVPANVTGSIVPKTLFGEKYVDLVVPAQGSPQTIQVGATIDRTQVSIEVEQVLSDLYPLLRTLQPAAVNKTLTALSNALEGRGEQIGENLETLDGYLEKFNPQVPQLVEDLKLLAQTSDVYADVFPQLGTILRNTIKTTGTLEEKESTLDTLFTDVSRFAGVTETFLDENEDDLIQLGDLGKQVLAVLARYAPEYPCLASGLAKSVPLVSEAFRNYTLHINLETLPNQPRGYDAGDRPKYGADNGPYCGKLMNPPWNQDNVFKNVPNIDDGINRPTGKGTSRVAPGATFAGSQTAADTMAQIGPRYDPAGAGLIGGTSETDVLRTILSGVVGEQPDEVDDLGVLLLGPLARGAEVSYR